MFGIFDKIEEFFKELLLGGIQVNLESMFLDINDKVGAVATEVGKTPSSWNSKVFTFIKSINENVVLPIAAIILTTILCIELIQVVMNKNSMHESNTLNDKDILVIKASFNIDLRIFDEKAVVKGVLTLPKVDK